MDGLFEIKKSDLEKVAGEWFDNLPTAELPPLIQTFAFLRLIVTEAIFLRLLLDAHPELESEVRPRVEALASFPRRLVDFGSVWPSNVFDGAHSKEAGREFDRALTDLALGKEVFNDEV